MLFVCYLCNMWYVINFSILSWSVPIFNLSLSIIYVLIKYLEERIVFFIKRKID